jgi:hypothetical protein
MRTIRLCVVAHGVSWTGIWLAIGLGLRLFHYLRNPSLWHDEAAVVLNVLHKGYAEFFGSLLFSEAAPPLFLCAEKAVVDSLGDSLYTFRLLPLLASCTALLAVVACARRLLSAEAVPWVAMMAACSDTVLWHSCEAKPYAVDLLIASGVLWLTTFGCDWPLRRLLLISACVAPLAIFLSFPACFLLGGLAVWFLAKMRHDRSLSNWFLFAVFLMTVCGSFLLLWLGPIQAQKDERMLSCWTHLFPNWQQPWTIPGWFALRSTEVVRYAYEPTGNVLFGVLLVGAVVLWRDGLRRYVVLLTTPILLAAAAGVLHQYPYGGVRVMAFAAPACWLLIGAGLPTTFHGMRRFRWIGPAVVVGLIAFPVAQAGYRVLSPWKRAETGPASAFILDRIQPGEIVIGNAWEDEYYFRGGRANYRRFDDVGSIPGDSIWVIATSADPAQRHEILKAVQASEEWEILQSRSFDRVDVHQLERLTPGRCRRCVESEFGGPKTLDRE